MCCFLLTRLSLAFILYRQHHQTDVIARNPGLPNPNISKIIGEQWGKESDAVKNSWKKLALEEKQRHSIQYPDYRYQPRRGGKNGNNQSSSATEDGRCVKCGGRFIATPRTPSTPSVGQGQAMLPPGPSTSRSADDSDGRRASQATGSTGMPRTAQYSYQSGSGYQKADETYEPLSPSPDIKRRRVGTGGNHQQTQYAVAQPNNALPHHLRPSFGTAPGLPQSYSPQRLPGSGQMAPPPRPMHPPYCPPIRAPAFDDVRLPPLHTQLTHSPPSAGSSARYVSPTGPVLSAGFDSQAKGVEAMIMSIPWDNKIEMLCRVCRPLPAPHPGSPGTETRGPVIVIDGPRDEMLREVGATVEKALASSKEVALKTWGENDPDVEVPEISAGERTQAVMSRSFLSYFDRVAKWYDRSNEIIQHITTQPGPILDEQAEKHASSEGSVSTSPKPRSSTEPSKPPSTVVPVALVPTGFSLTLCDKFARAAPIADAYSPVDHWGWMANLWRGVVGPDLFIYVPPSSEEEMKKAAGVEILVHGVMVVRVEEGRGMSEKLKRRLAFEVVEWVRGGTYRSEV